MNYRLTILCAFAASALAADLPYAGKWKADLAKSDFGETTMTLESQPAGQWQCTAFGITYRFRMDGMDYPDGMGGNVSWKSIDATTWQLTAKANGTVTGVDTFKLDWDGKSLTDTAKMMKAAGGSIESTTVYERAGGGPGLAGKWKTKKVSGGSSSIEIVASKKDGLTFKDTDMGMICDGKLDGKDYACTGPMLPPGFTVAFQNAEHSLALEVKKDGKPFFKATYTASPDGKVLTEEGATASGSDKFKIVFDRM